ncbi:MAG: aldose 1-epimerase [Gemmataceae bacterium]|nr:aldose 1-epimerase [Gemmataceae bacterium]
MLYHIETDERMAGGHASTMYTLSRRDVGSLAEIWPDYGFNCVRWQADAKDLLFKSPDWNENPLSTRSGVPILFPFPNRIRDGLFVHKSRSYQLPKNDSTHANSIHGFSPRNRWRVVETGARMNEAWVQADFRIRTEAPEAAGLWPGDGILSVIYRLTPEALRIEMRVINLGDSPFPFGVGLHPYFRLPAADANCSRYVLHAPARSIWPLKANLPIGEKQPVPDELNWNNARMLAGTELDTVYSDLGVIQSDNEGLLHRASLGHDKKIGQIEMWTSSDFRESVLYTPPHRQAICIEPYTCVTDAVNLQGQGVDAGWRELAPEGEWSGVVEFRWNSTE